MSEKITCEICGQKEHSIQLHLRDKHPEVSLEEYIERYPTAPLMSELAKERLAQKRSAVKPSASDDRLEMAGTSAGATIETLIPKGNIVKKPFHELFNLGKAKLAMSAKGEAIPISVVAVSNDPDMVPVISDDYVYDIDELKNVILGLELNIPTYIWGHKGCGKTELIEQVCARTNRAALRVQHTVNTEESHIVGQWTVRDGHTVFELGPLATAMRQGWVYCADEYDFTLPSVLSVYQAVLEGKSLVIKEADAANRIIKPHPNFRFVATGNTNGSGDDTGLYQGTSLQNSANYDRFGMVINKKYMNKVAESQILQNRVGLVKEDSDKMVDFAGLVRDAYDGSKISDTISPRTLIYAAKIGVKRGSFRQGLMLSFVNKLSRIDREVVDGLAQRVFG
jgi:cobaltochelatase CobS